MIPEPEITLDNYVSYFCTKYRPWFVELGYPMLDVQQWPDGEWAIIEFLNQPLIPSLTKWHYVLTGLRNIEITYPFLQKYLYALDLHRDGVWDREEKKSQHVEFEHERQVNFQVDVADRAYRAVKRNEGLMERIARNGLKELAARSIFKNIPRYRF